MATLPASSHLFTRDGPTLQPPAEANQQLPQPCLFGHGVNELPPSHHSRPPTPPELSLKDLKYDDPDLRLKLERNSRTFVANWEKYRNESMTEEQKRRELAEQKMLRELYASRKREEAEDFKRLLDEICRRESTGLFIVPGDAEQSELQSQGRDLAEHASIQAEEVLRAASLQKGQKAGETA
jgi:hypothetical protein